MQEIYDYSIFGNTVFNYLSSLAIFICGMAVVYVFKKYILSRLEKWADSNRATIDDLLVSAIEKSLMPAFYFGVFYIALHTLVLSAEFKHGLRMAAIVLITLLAVRAVISAVNSVR